MLYFPLFDTYFVKVQPQIVVSRHAPILSPIIILMPDKCDICDAIQSACNVLGNANNQDKAERMADREGGRKERDKERAALTNS